MGRDGEGQDQALTRHVIPCEVGAVWLTTGFTCLADARYDAEEVLAILFTLYEMEEAGWSRKGTKVTPTTPKKTDPIIWAGYRRWKVTK